MRSVNVSGSGTADVDIREGSRYYEPDMDGTYRMWDVPFQKQILLLSRPSFFRPETRAKARQIKQ